MLATRRPQDSIRKSSDKGRLDAIAIGRRDPVPIGERDGFLAIASTRNHAFATPRQPLGKPLRDGPIAAEVWSLVAFSADIRRIAHVFEVGFSSTESTSFE